MEVNQIIAGIDEQIRKLTLAREALAGVASVPLPKAGRGRPKGTGKSVATKSAKKTTSRKLSPEGRKRIAEAMKRRWAERRKAAAKSTSAK